MLKSLLIKNFALIEKLELEFSPTFNVIIGETGAGKSIIIDALMLALGERASTDFIRKGEKKAIIEAVFSINKDKEFIRQLIDLGYEIDDNDLILRREILDKGNSRCFVNDTPIQVNLLKQLGDNLVDFHGQHDHQLLLKTEYHIRILDNLSSFNELQEKYLKNYNELKDKINYSKELHKREKEYKQKEELFRFELAEILKVAPLPDEENLLESELNILQNSEKLFTLSSELYNILYEGVNSAHDLLINAKKNIEQISAIDASYIEFVNECNSAVISIDEISKFTKDYNSKILFDPERIEEIRERITQLKGLRKKYGTFEQIFSRQSVLENELALIENFDTEKSKVKQEIIGLKLSLGVIANEISIKRKISAEKLEKSIVETLKLLGIENGSFKTLITNEEINISLQANEQQITAIINNMEYKANNNGIDKVEFLISTNKGEEPKQLSEIASGGEISRVMLSIKNIIAESDEVPLLVFDEIDSGISGRIAQKVGITMKQISEKHQIIAITHLPQIAALADRNIHVVKSESDENTIVNAYILDEEKKIYEIAKLISGEEVTEASIEQAYKLSKLN